MPMNSTIGITLIFWLLSSLALPKQGLKQWLTLSFTSTLDEWIPLVTLAASSCHGMKAPPSFSKLSPIASIFMLLWRYHLPFFPFYLLPFTPPLILINVNFVRIIYNHATSVSLPWVLLGDFNDMLSDNEKLGGLPVNRTHISAFRNFMDKCGLMDLGFHSPRFMWTNKSPMWQSNIKERLDRGLGNAEWTLLFPAAEVHHLPKVKSDHCPILLNTDPLESNPPNLFGLSKYGLSILPSLPLWRIAGKLQNWFHLLPPPYLGSLGNWMCWWITSTLGTKPILAIYSNVKPVF